MTDEIILRFSVKDDGTPVIEKVNKKLGETKKTVTNELMPGLESARGKLTSFVGTNAALIGVLVGVGAALHKVTGDTVAYANEVRTLSNVTGSSTEDASRFLQVIDDYGLGLSDATTAARAMKEQGLVPTIDALAQLSDQYLSIQDPAEKLSFIQKNLGRDTAKWTEVLSKGSKTLRAQNDAVGESLILSKKQVEAARQLEVAQDGLTDAWEGAKVTLGNKLIPLLTDVIGGFNVYTRAIEISKEQNIGFWEATDIAGREIWEEQQAMAAMQDAADSAGSSLDGLSESQEAAEETAKRMSDVYQSLLSSMFSIQQQNDSYADTLEDLTKKDQELAASKDQLTLKMWQEQQAGKLTNDEYMRYVQQLAEVTAAQEENAKAREEAAADNEQQSQQRVYDLAQQKLAADGIVTSGEYEYLQNLAVSYGLVSRSAADQAISEEKRANALVASFEQTLPPMERSLATMQAINAMNGTVVNFGVNFQTSGQIPGQYGGTGIGAPPPKSVRPPKGRDSGGAGIAGEPYMIGTGAQPEIFVPSTNGQFIPNANKIGSTYNIVINNPKKETAENSIRQSLKKLSYAGVVS